MIKTLETMVRQSLLPAKWKIVDDGSTDVTPEILASYSDRYDVIKVITRHNRGHRSVGLVVIEAFQAGLETVDLNDQEYRCKLDLDLDLPATYLETLITKMMANPCIVKAFVTEAVMPMFFNVLKSSPQVSLSMIGSFVGVTDPACLCLYEVEAPGNVS